MNTAISRRQRWSRDSPCPVCGGWDQMSRGAGSRCYGFQSEDPNLIICTREEFANGEVFNDKVQGYIHRRTESTLPRPNVKVVETIKYPLNDRSGTTVAIHVRNNLTDGTKRFHWEQPDGGFGLNGLASAKVPLYGIDRLNGHAGVVLVEGEKAADALQKLDVPVLATTTGAHVTPDDSVLRDLIYLKVYLWPDNDDIGRTHMQKIGERLQALGNNNVFTIDWKTDQKGADAYDYVAEGKTIKDVRRLVKNAPKVDKPKKTGAIYADQLADDLYETDFSAVESSFAITGIEPLDQLIGGIDLKWLMIIGGRAGMGKSTMLIQILVNMSLRGISTAMISLEMTPKSISHRMAGVVADLDMSRYSSESWYRDTHQKQFAEAVAMIHGLPSFRIFEGYDRRHSKIMEQLKDQYQQNPFSIVGIDHLHTIEVDRTTGSQVTDLTKIVQDLRQFALDYNVTVILLSQLNRKSDDRESGVTKASDLRGSGGIEETADVALTIRRSDEFPLVTDVNLIKHRYRPDKKRMALKFDGGRGRFTWNEGDGYDE